MAETALLVFRRRRPRRPFAELDWNAEDAQVDPEAAVSLLPSDDEDDDDDDDDDGQERIESSASGAMTRRKSSASKRQKLRGATIVEELKETPSRWSGTFLGSIGKETPSKGAGTVVGSKENQAHGSEENSSEHPGKVNSRWSMSPEFVKEKRAMFAEIDSFELESEEESLDNRRGDPLDTEGQVVESSAKVSRGKSPSRGESSAPSTHEAGPSNQFESEAQDASCSGDRGSDKAASASEAGGRQADSDPPFRKYNTKKNRTEGAVDSTRTARPSESDSNLHSGGPSMSTRSRTQSPFTIKTKRGVGQTRAV